MPPENPLVLVNDNDDVIGTAEKLSAHTLGQLHRAFSIQVVNDRNELLLQKRAANKYHSGGLWTNTCCSHAVTNEDTNITALRRLNEEMGIVCEIIPLFTFKYKVVLDNNFIEHEIDHVFAGRFNGEPKLNPDEAESYRWASLEDIRKDAEHRPDQYTYWFKKIIAYPGFARMLAEQ